jgi:hypothetical protein
MRLAPPLARTLAFVFALFAGAAAVPAARADIYKCLGDDSQPVYQDTPCPTGRELRNFQADPATVSVVPFAPPTAEAPSPPSPKASKRSSKSSDTASTNTARARGKPGIPPGNATERRFLHTGMSDAEVLARIGAPDIKSGNPDSRGGARWSYLPTDGDPGMITTLHIQSGQLTQVDRKPSR